MSIVVIGCPCYSFKARRLLAQVLKEHGFEVRHRALMQEIKWSEANSATILDDNAELLPLTKINCVVTMIIKEHEFRMLVYESVNVTQ